MKNIMRMPLLQLFAKKKKNRGALWASLVGLGISAAVFGVTKGKKKMPNLPIQNIGNMVSGLTQKNNNGNMFSGLTPKSNIGSMDTAALTEFSEELLEDALNKDKK